MAIACLSLDLSAVRYQPLRVLLPCRLAWSRVCTGVPTDRQPQPAAACPCRPGESDQDAAGPDPAARRPPANRALARAPSSPRLRLRPTAPRRVSQSQPRANSGLG